MRDQEEITTVGALAADVRSALRRGCTSDLMRQFAARYSSHGDLLDAVQDELLRLVEEGREGAAVKVASTRRGVRAALARSLRVARRSVSVDSNSASLVSVSQQSSPEQVTIARELLSHIYGSASPEDWLRLHERFVLDLDISEIAARHGLTSGGVRKWLRRFRNSNRRIAA